MLIFICILSSFCICVTHSEKLVFVYVMKETERRSRVLALEGFSVGMYSGRTVVVVLFAFVIHIKLFKQYDSFLICQKKLNRSDQYNEENFRNCIGINHDSYGNRLRRFLQRGAGLCRPCGFVRSRSFFRTGGSGQNGDSDDRHR